jgi:RHS repeat-associated protein
VAEVSSVGVWNRGEVYAGGRHLATYTGGASGATYFDTTDWQGTERVRTGISGPIVETCTNLPFGDGLTCTGSDVSPMHFTGQQLDSETNLTHMEFRSYSTVQGRWTSMDPAGKGATNAADPQSWNLYAYVMNNPLSLTDPSGLEGVGQQWGGLPSGGPCDESTGYCIKMKAGAPHISDAGIFFVGSANRVADQIRKVGGQVAGAYVRAGKSVYRGYSIAAKAVAQGLTGNPQTSLTNFSTKDLNNVFANLTLFLAPEEAGTNEELVNLNKSLASEAQMGETGTAIMGGDTGVPLKQADRLASQYGGEPGDWQKMTSSNYKAADGSMVETHWYQNDAINSGKVEIKSKIDPN